MVTANNPINTTGKEFFNAMCYYIAMRKFLTTLLMLLMLVPGLACGPFMHAGKAQAASPMQGMGNCHGMGMDASKKAPGYEGRFFFKDCMKADLSGVDHVDFKAPDLSGKAPFIAWVAVIPDNSFRLAGIQFIRGPPPDWPDHSQTQPSLLLTTQRFRE